MAGSPPPGNQGYPQQPQQGHQQHQQGYPPPGQSGPGYNPAAPFGVDPRSGIPYSDKQKMVAGLLQILLGGFGVGRFYIGDTSTGVWQLVVTILTCGIGAWWGIIDGIIMLTSDDITDASGRPLRPN